MLGMVTHRFKPTVPSSFMMSQSIAIHQPGRLCLWRRSWRTEWWAGRASL